MLGACIVQKSPYNLQDCKRARSGLAGLLSGWLAGSASWLAGWPRVLAGWLAGWLACWSRLIYRLTESWLSGWLAWSVERKALNLVVVCSGSRWGLGSGCGRRDGGSAVERGVAESEGAGLRQILGQQGVTGQPNARAAKWCEAVSFA